jgi:outer membrane protein OmpA-like peptidoglycan-associated protein
MIRWSATAARGACLCVAGAAISCLLGPPVQAEEVAEQQIVDKLAPLQRKIFAATSRLTLPVRASQTASVDRNPRDRPQRSLSDREPREVAEVAPELPAINLQVRFDFGSAVITPQAIPQLMSLGRALSSPWLRNAAILIAGHTDARGDEAYNQALSERRAESVKRFLLSNFPVSAANLKAVGHGEARLVNQADPFAAENRRVEIVNLSAGKVAGGERVPSGPRRIED